MSKYQAANVEALQKYTRLNTQCEVESASQHRLIQMLMEGALDRIIKAKSYIKNRELQLKGEFIGMAISIIGGLRDSLDHETGAELAENLDKLYEYMSARLLEANVNNDVEILEEVHKLMMEIKTAWDAIADIPPPQVQAGAIDSKPFHKRAI